MNTFKEISFNTSIHTPFSQLRIEMEAHNEIVKLDGFTDARMEATVRTVQNALSRIKEEDVKNVVDEKWQSLTKSPASDKTLHDLCLEGDQFRKELKMTAAMVGSMRAAQTRTQNSGGAAPQ